MTKVRGIGAIALALAATTALAGCGGGGGSDSSATSAPTYTKPTGSGGSTATVPDGSNSSGTPTGKVRVLNAFAPAGTTGPTLDLYDTPTPAKDDEPVIEGLEYGEISDYVRPKGNYGSAGNLYIFEAGTKERSTSGSSQDINGQAISNGGFDKGTQRTLVIGTGNAFDDDTKNAPVYQEISEEGTGNMAPPPAWQADDAKGLLLVNTRGAETDRTSTEYYLSVDGTCPTRRDPENTAGGAVEMLANSNAVPFLVTAGSHEIKVLAAPGDNGLSTCDQSAAKVSDTVDVDAGTRVEVFLVAPGDDPTDFKLVVAPVSGD